MKKLLLFASLSILTFTNNFAQTNLVTNGGFETASPCPNYPGQINYATGWNNVNLLYNNSSVGTPDLFHACGSSSVGYNCVPPNTFAGVCMPKTGNGFAATVLYNVPYPGYREYFSSQLNDAMVPGTTYTVSFWITNGSTPYSPWTVKNVGVHLSASPLTQSGWNQINISPTYEITGYSGSKNWVQYSFTVNPTSTLNYITLGNFRTDASNTPVSTYTGTSGPASSYANYFWDDIQVMAPSTAGIRELNSKYADLNIYPNPSSDLVNFSSTNAVDEISIANYLGQKVRTVKLDATEKNISVKDLSAGIYFIQFYNKNELVSTKKLVKE